MKVINKADNLISFTKDTFRDFCKKSKSYKLTKDQQDWLNKNPNVISELHKEFLDHDMDIHATSRIEALSVKYLGENDPLVDGGDFA